MTDKADGGSVNVEIVPFKNISEPMVLLDEFIKESSERQRQYVARERKNPDWKRNSVVYQAECKKRLLSDGWSLEDAAHLLAGYIPGRPKFNDKGQELITMIGNALRNSEGATLHPSKRKLLGADLFPTRDLIKWAIGKNIPLTDALMDQIGAVKSAQVGSKEKRPRKDTLQRKEAQERAVAFWESELNETGKKRSQTEVARYLIRELDYLEVGDEDKIKRWIKPVCPWRDENQAKYGL